MSKQFSEATRVQIPAILHLMRLGYAYLPTIDHYDRKTNILTDVFKRKVKELNPEAFFGEYVQTYLERDIRELGEIRNERKFIQFLSCVAVRTGQELNLSDMAKDIGIDSKTADSWLSLLVTTGIVYLLQPYFPQNIILYLYILPPKDEICNINKWIASFAM